MKESEIRPHDLFKKYLELSREDSNNFDKSNFFKTTHCLACDSDKLKDKIIKDNFTYQLCLECNSLFCNPRPSKQALDNFYSISKSAKFWFQEFLPAVEQNRKEKLFRKKAAELKKLIQNYGISFKTLCDCGAGSGLFLEELKKVFLDVKFSAIEPGEFSHKILTGKGINTLKQTVENAHEWGNRFDFVTCLEVFEHVHDPKTFVSSLYKLLKKDGYCLITSLGYEGFDILTLKDQSNSISPPHHLNFLSIDGFDKLFKKSGFKIIDIFTPGVLDVDIVLNSESCPEFLKVIQSRGNEALEEFQNFLIKNKLSSHVWALAKK